MRTVLFDTSMTKGYCWNLCDPGLEKPYIARVKAMAPIQSPSEGAGYRQGPSFLIKYPCSIFHFRFKGQHHCEVLSTDGFTISKHF